jgi:hypothetical protein
MENEMYMPEDVVHAAMMWVSVPYYVAVSWLISEFFAFGFGWVVAIILAVAIMFTWRLLIEQFILYKNAVDITELTDGNQDDRL